MSQDLRPFRIEVPDAELDDLRRRLRSTRWPEPATVGGWEQGVPLDYVRRLCEYWADGYQWRRREEALNCHPQFLTEIDGLDIHFLHVPSRHEGAMPLVLTHGWPGSFVEFLHVIEALTDPPDPADAFSLVIPSLPGYAFSAKPIEAGWGVERTARAWAELMGRLGYERFGAQGGDWGAAVTTSLAAQFPDRVAGFHINMVVAFPGPDDGEPTEMEAAALERFQWYMDKDSGYSKIQSTRPQTIGYPLVDSPAGLCAWILEKFHAWTDTAGDPVGALGADRILDDVMLYWLTASGASSARMYWESFTSFSFSSVDVPMGASIFPLEIFKASRRWAAHRFSDIRWWGELDRGGHFAAFEQPELFVEEIRGFFRTVR